MKKIKNLPENNFLILFFLLFSLAFLIASLVALDRAFLFEGMEQILTQPCKIPTNYFAVGGYSATFFNMGLVTLACLGLYLIFRAELNGGFTAALTCILVVPQLERFARTKLQRLEAKKR